MIAGLYRRYAPELVRYIRKYTEDQAAAEDIVQETFVRGDDFLLLESDLISWRCWKNHSAGPGCIGRQKISALIVPEEYRQSRPGREKPFRMTT